MSGSVGAERVAGTPRLDVGGSTGAVVPGRTTLQTAAATAGAGGRPGTVLPMEPTAGRPAAANAAATVERAADVLLLFAEAPHRALGVTEIAATLGLSKTAVHRILASLRNKGLIELDPASRKYALGSVMIGLGISYLDGLDVRAMAAPELEVLSAGTNETATLSVRTGWSRMYVDQVTPDREVLMSVQLGVRHPLHAGASSKAMLAFMADEDVEAYLRGPLVSVTPATVVDPIRLRRELRRIRRQGFAQSTGERQIGAGSVAAPVLDHRGQVVAVVSVCGPAERMAGEIDRCVEQLLGATGRISDRWRGRSAGASATSVPRDRSTGGRGPVRGGGGTRLTGSGPSTVTGGTTRRP